MDLDKDHSVELSIIVPILNEMEQLPDFFADITRQEGISPELLICDGGSIDGSYEWLLQQQANLANLLVLQGPAGRGRQLNQGARYAHGNWLLFLHADSRFDDPQALKKGLACLAETGSRQVAGHFALKFRHSGQKYLPGYYFYEWKARLGRAETIHGDQGFLLHRRLVEAVGPFNEELPAMEDTVFAERLRRVGQWQLLPAEISTSARRFEVEGLWQRQLLGALLMCFRTIGWNDFFAAAPDVYRQQRMAGPLQVKPFFSLVRQLLNGMSWRDRWRIWYRSGTYVRAHAWQLLFAMDVRRAFRRARPVGEGPLVRLDFFEPIFNLLTDNFPGRVAATVLLRGWFELTAFWLTRKERD